MLGRHLYNFGISQEDEATEASALQLSAGDRVLSIASAGEMPSETAPETVASIGRCALVKQRP